MEGVESNRPIRPVRLSSNLQQGVLLFFYNNCNENEVDNKESSFFFFFFSRFSRIANNIETIQEI